MTEALGDPREGRVVAAIPADTFGHRLMLVRAHLDHLTVKEAAERCGLSYGSWSNWERGMVPRDKVDIADVIASSLGIDRDWLLHGGPLTTPPRPVRKVRKLLNERYGSRSRGESSSRRVGVGPGSPRRPRRLDPRPRVAA